MSKGIKVVSNAGGLDPHACASAVAAVAAKLGVEPKIAVVDGDDLLPRMDDLRAEGLLFANLDTGAPLAGRSPVTANAYLGGWGIAQALAAGADIVITGRVTDAALVVGPAAWHHGWLGHQWDQLAGAVVAGHIIECGCQATGGNYSFFQQIPGLEHPGFPIAEVRADGSSVITKHPGTGGAVTVGTVTAQLLYEIDGTEYANPDVVARFDTVSISQLGPDRVLISRTKGLPAPDSLKVAVNFDGGFRNRFTFCLTGLDIEAKAALVERTLWAAVPGGRESIRDTRVDLVRTDKPDPESNESAVALLRFTVRDADERRIGRAFTNAAIEMALATYPGMFGIGGPTAAEPYGVYWPTLVPVSAVPHRITIDGVTTPVEVPNLGGVDLTGVGSTDAEESGGDASPLGSAESLVVEGPTVRVPLGTVFGARSGDKGGNANVGVWAPNFQAYLWLRDNLTETRVRDLLPEAAGLPIRIAQFPNICALNIVIVGLLDEGVAAATRMDGQAKGLGEWLRARYVELPQALLTRIP